MLLNRRVAILQGSTAAGLIGLGLPVFARPKLGIYAPGQVALGGTDPVAYFTAGGPMQGNPDMALKWKGALWFFSTEPNLIAFEMDPRSYAPCFGGHCAMSMARGVVSPSTPEAFAIESGRLYLCESQAVLAEWQRDVTGNIRQGKAHWEKLVR